MNPKPMMTSHHSRLRPDFSNPNCISRQNAELRAQVHQQKQHGSPSMHSSSAASTWGRSHGQSYTPHRGDSDTGLEGGDDGVDQEVPSNSTSASRSSYVAEHHSSRSGVS